MVAISLILIGGCSVLRSRTSLRTSRSKAPRGGLLCPQQAAHAFVLEADDPAAESRFRGSGLAGPLGHGAAEDDRGADPLVLYLLGPLQEQLKLPPVLGGFDPRASGHLPLPSSDTLPSPASL